MILQLFNNRFNSFGPLHLVNNQRLYHHNFRYVLLAYFQYENVLNAGSQCNRGGAKYEIINVKVGNGIDYELLYRVYTDKFVLVV